MRVVVFGTGGVGGYFGGRLAAAGEDVVFIARGDHLRAIRSQGLRVASIKGDFVVYPANATDDPAEVGIADVILVAVKAWQVSEVVGSLTPMLGTQTFVVPLENGVEAPFQLADALGAERVLGGLCKIISFIAGPGRIRHAGAEPFVAFGELDNRKSQRVDQLRQTFERAGVKVQVPEDIHVAIWEKFLFIASISGVGAVTRAPIGVLRSIPETREMLEQAMREIYEVARARKVFLAEDAVDRTMNFVDSLPPSGTASMQRDIMDGRPSELASQSGAVVRLGKEAGVETPVHAFIFHSLLPLELRAHGQMEFPV